MARARIYKENKARALAYLGGVCVSCGSENRLEFDHINRDRVGGDAGCVTQQLGYSWETILKELAKCQLLCHECHLAKTKEERAQDRATNAQHGTATKYRYGCRCQPCSDTHKNYLKDYRKKQLVVA